jgi:serine/threonine protein phosphatase 1
MIGVAGALFEPAALGLSEATRSPYLRGMLKRLFRSSVRTEQVAQPTIPPGRRVYAIGDIHGRLDLLDRLLAAIVTDARDRGEAQTTLIFLGDLIDRGPDSASVVERAIALSKSELDVRFIQGNHEEAFLAALKGTPGAMRFLLRIGGRETLESYGLDERDHPELDYDDLAELACQHVPEAHRTFLAGFEDMIAIGDYLFVHAGVRPGVHFDSQKASDLRWIREEFLDHAGSHGAIIVHGHTITDAVQVRDNRIGIDTGAFQSDCLTAIGLEGRERWFLDTAA